MKKLVIILTLIFVPTAFTQDVSRVTLQYHDGSGNEVFFIDDFQTGTRCYAITNNGVNNPSYAISCVARQK